MTTASIDTERLKRGVDLRDLAGRLVMLRKESTAELSGPCPKCGGDDRFHVKEDLAFCRQCWPLERKTPAHDAIGFVQWAGLARDFRGAVEYLGGNGRAWRAPTGPRRAPEPKPPAARWQDPQWQSDARALLAHAQDCLASPAGDPGAEYLLSRGILPETWETWGLGYVPDAWDRKLAEHLLRQDQGPATWPALGLGAKQYKGDWYATRPAIVIPWQGKAITALKYRFLTVPDGALRYTSKSGGEQMVFGRNLAGGHWSTLWLCEGELNALSLWQALRAAYMVNFDVGSFGGDSVTANLHEHVKAWAGKYQQVIVWADKPDKALSAMQSLPKTYGLFGLRSPVIEGRKLDANALLAEPGALARFAAAAWDRFDKDLAYIGRVEEAVKALPDRAAA